MSLHSIVDVSCRCLETLEEALHSLDPELYAKGSQKMGSISMHVRHIAEHYTTLAGGLESGRFSYDCRERDRLLETSVEAAMERLRDIRNWLTALTDHSCTALCYEARIDPAQQDSLVQIETNLRRELVFLHCHTIHHMAILAKLLCDAGVQVPDTFGVAPSTLHHLAASTS